jgi:hypothetical protein
MKADGAGYRIYNDISASTHQPKPPKTKSKPAQINSGIKSTPDIASSIERTDQIAARVNQKLQTMANVLNQMGNENNDIVRAQLARFFHVLRAYIEEALHPTGDWSTDQILSGKSVNVNPGENSTTIAIQGERMNLGSKGFSIGELPKSPTSEDIQGMMHNIKNAQASVKKLRNNLSSARSQIAYHSKGSSTLTI